MDSTSRLTEVYVQSQAHAPIALCVPSHLLLGSQFEAASFTATTPPLSSAPEANLLGP